MTIFGFIILIDLILGVIFYDYLSELGFNYIDEFICFWLFLILLKKIIFDNIKIHKFFYYIIFIYLFYLTYSLCIKINVWHAIISDFFVMAKPIVAFLSVATISNDFSRNDRKILNITLFFSFIILLIVGLFSYESYIIFDHPSRYATACVACSFLSWNTNRNNTRKIIIFILFLCLGLLSLRAKMNGFFIFALFFLTFNYRFFFANKFRIKKIPILTIIILTIPVLYISWDKFHYYFIYGYQDSSDIFARPALYITSWQIALDYFPLGTGFGSFGSYFSALYYSPVYDMYGLYNVHGLTYWNYSFAADSFFPCLLGQFGFLGLILFFIFWAMILRKAFAINNYFLPFLIFVFFMIESVADSTFTHNRGMFTMIILGLCLRASNRGGHKEKGIKGHP